MTYEQNIREALTLLLKGKKITGVAVNVTPATHYGKPIVAVNLRVDGASLTFCVLDERHLIIDAVG